MGRMSDRRIHVGIGGWTYEPWRGTFYPPGLPHAKELHYASRQLTAIEVNGTFYSTFGPATFAKWRDQTPDGFIFSLKAHRFTTHRKLLATAGEGITRFIGSGLHELREKLGPIVWQLMPTAKFDAEQMAAFFALLPREVEGLPLRHVIDARHESFASDAYLELAYRHGISTVHTDDPEIPPIADPRMELVYLRLMRTASDCDTGYAPQEIAKWAQGCKAWIDGGASREVFAFFISGAKERAPAAAMALLRELGVQGSAGFPPSR